MRVLLLSSFFLSFLVVPVLASRVLASRKRKQPAGDEFLPAEFLPSDNPEMLATSPGDWLKFSFRVDERAAQFVAVHAPIFNLPQREIITLSRPRFFTDSTSATDSAELAQQSSSKLSLNLKYSPFNMGVQHSTDVGATWKYKTYRADRFEKYEKYHVTSTIIDRAQYLTSSARDFLLTNSPEDIERRLGTFYATSLRMGAVVKVSHVERMSWQETKQSIEEKVEAGYEGDLGADIGIDGKYHSRSTDESRVVRIARLVVGGDAKVWFNLKEDSSNLEDIKERWSRGVTDSNLVPVELHLEPVWALLDGIDSKKAASLKSYFESKWAGELQALPLLPPGPALVRCNWKEFSSCMWGTGGAFSLCPNEVQCVKTGITFCWNIIPGMAAECDCNSVCWQDDAHISCCPPSDASPDASK